MPRDRRLYLTLSLDFHRHPKITRLPVEVRWTFLEMISEARTADNDGEFLEEDARFMWPQDHLDALCASHPSRPLVEHAEGFYRIRDYAEHQETRAAREARTEKNRANGAKGGRPKNREITHSKPSGFPVGTEPEPTGNPPLTEPKPNETQHKAESESESESEDLTKTYASQSSNKRARDSTDSLSAVSTGIAGRHGITDIDGVVGCIRSNTGRDVTQQLGLQVALEILDKAKELPRAPQRYVLSAIARSPFEVQQFIDRQVTA